MSCTSPMRDGAVSKEVLKSELVSELPEEDSVLSSSENESNGDCTDVGTGMLDGAELVSLPVFPKYTDGSAPESFSGMPPLVWFMRPSGEVV